MKTVKSGHNSDVFQASGIVELANSLHIMLNLALSVANPEERELLKPAMDFIIGNQEEQPQC